MRTLFLVPFLFSIALPAAAQSARDFPTPNLGERVPLMLQGCLNAQGQAVPQSAACASGASVSGTVMANQGAPNGGQPWPTVVYVAGAAASPSNPSFVSVTNFPATQPVSATALPLPAGAATSAKQPAIGTAGSPSADVLSIQGVVGGVPQPVTAASLPLPAGAATAALQGIEQGSAAASVGITPVLATAATSLVGKSSAGNLYGAYAYNTTATASFLVAVNATAVPAVSATIVPVECVPLPASGSATVNYGAGPPDAYSTGIVILISTSCTTYTVGGSSFIKARVR